MNNEPYIYINIEDLSGMMKLNSGAEMQVLVFLWKYSSTANKEAPYNMINTGGLLYKDIKDTLGIKDNSIRNIICDFNKKNILIKDRDTIGVYYLNPIYFFKGNLEDRDLCLKYIFSSKD